MPLNPKENTVWYGHVEKAAETELLVGRPGKSLYVEFEVAEVVTALFRGDKVHGMYEHSKTNPPFCPEQRFKRHRNPYVYRLNEFRHWWKTSRLLVRVSGGYEYCLSPVTWEQMGWYNVSKRRHGRKALKSMKWIGRGGVSKEFLNNVKEVRRFLSDTVVMHLLTYSGTVSGSFIL
jgi:hypothetical protein